VHQVLLLEEITATGCEVEFLDRPMSQDPHNQLLLQRRGAVAEDARSVIAERMHRGRLRQLSAGILLPWTRAPTAIGVIPSDRGIPPESGWIGRKLPWWLRCMAGPRTRPVVSSGWPRRCSRLECRRRGCRDVTTLWAIWTTPVSAGQGSAGRIQAAPYRVRPPEDWIAVAHVPAIVTQAQFDRVQTKIAQNRQCARRNNTAHRYLLRALVSCGGCGLACLGRSLPSGDCDDCGRGKPSALQADRDTRCPSRFIPAEQVDDLVWTDLGQVLTHPEAIRFALERVHGGHWLPKDLQARREVLRRGQSHLQQQIERLTEADRAGVLGLEECRRRRRDLDQTKEALAAQVRQLEAQVDRQTAMARVSLSIDEFCRRVRDGLEQATWEQKRQWIEWLVVRVIVTDGEVEIRYAIPTSPAGEATRFCHLPSDYRALVLSPEELAAHGNALRPAGPQLPRGPGADCRYNRVVLNESSTLHHGPTAGSWPRCCFPQVRAKASGDVPRRSTARASRPNIVKAATTMAASPAVQASARA
jgi:site-specific DNA recombinase